MAYTPIFDSLFELDSINLTDVAVFGAVWRYAQGELGKCTASPETISERIGVTHNTVRASLKKLCGLGLLTDLTPDVRYKAHEYSPTDYALKIIAGEVRLPESNEEDTKNRLPEIGNQEEEAYQKLVTSLPEIGNLGYQKLVTKKELRIDSREQESPAPTRKDYLGDIVTQQDQVDESTGPNPDDQWLEYRDKALKAFPGDWGRTAEEKGIKRGLILEFVAKTPTFDPDHWAFVIQDSIAHGVSSNNIARFIEVYPFKNYDDYLGSKFPRGETNGRDSPYIDNGKVEIKTVRRADGGFN